MPVGCPVNFRAMGTRSRSYSPTEVRMVMPVQTCSVAGGMTK